MDIGPLAVVVAKRQPIYILGDNDTVLGAAGTFNQPNVDVKGFSKLKGFFHTLTAAAAAGFPRVRMGPDGLTWPLVFVIPRDLAREAEVGSPGPFIYTFELDILARYVSVEFTAGAGGANPLISQIMAEP